MILFPSAVVLALTTLANAQDNGQNATYLNGLLQALNGAGLTTLATAVGFVNSTGAGNQLLATLSNQKNNYTILAPNNDACQSISFVTSSSNSILTFASSLSRTWRRHPRPQQVDERRLVPCRVWSLCEHDQLPKHHDRSYRSGRLFCRDARRKQETSRRLVEA